MIYAVENAEKNVTFKFEYNDKIYDDDDEVDINIENPFEVCHGTDCKTDIKTYDFEKGQSYKINAKVQKVGESEISDYVLPAFSFEPDSSSNSFFVRINLMAFALLLLIL